MLDPLATAGGFSYASFPCLCIGYKLEVGLSPHTESTSSGSVDPFLEGVLFSPVALHSFLASNLIATGESEGIYQPEDAASLSSDTALGRASSRIDEKGEFTTQAPIFDLKRPLDEGWVWVQTNLASFCGF
ncbi:MAG: hypothetical protein SNJ68_10965 [Cyanobacteriota bacterium]